MTPYAKLKQELRQAREDKMLARWKEKYPDGEFIVLLRGHSHSLIWRDTPSYIRRPHKTIEVVHALSSNTIRINTTKYPLVFVYPRQERRRSFSSLDKLITYSLGKGVRNVLIDKFKELYVPPQD